MADFLAERAVFSYHQSISTNRKELHRAKKIYH